MQNKICIYAICKNEKQFVDRWLESMQEADSIVVLDTGSTDGTYEYLLAKKEQYHQLIVQQQIIQPWRFDVARNESMKYIPDDCNILMSTDLDEILNPGWAQTIRERWIEGLHERGIYLYTWSHLEDGTDGRIFLYDKIHSRNWIWKAPVHEYLYNINEGTENYSTMSILDLSDEDKVHLHHYPDNNKSRSSYLPLLELREKENPNDYYGLIYLAREYMFYNMSEKAIEKFNYIINNLANQGNQLEIASCYCFLGECYTQLEKYQEAINSYLYAINLEPTYRESYIAIGKIYFKLGNYDLAKYYVKQGIKNSVRHYTWLENNVSWSWEPWDLLCQICFYNGDRLESIGYAAKALTYEPSNKRLQDNLDICIQLSQDNELI